MSPSIESVPVQDLDVLLGQTLGNNFEIKHVDWKPLTDPGENFGSVILAINVTITRDNKTETLNLVAKLPPKSAYLLDLFNSPLTFKKELHFYSCVMKEFLNLQLENGMKEEDLCRIAPNYFGGRLGLRDPEVFDEQAAIVLENLKYSGYTTEDRIMGLDKEHTEFAVRELAKLHAITIALKLKKPEFFKKNVLSILSEMVNETAKKCVIDMVRKAQQDLKNIPEAASYTDRINKTIEHSLRALEKPTNPEEPWGTMIHNDFWVNNMLFQHSQDGRVAGMKMVDFQLCVYEYGVCDLIFFLISSARRDVLDNNLGDMLDAYYDAFIKCLETLHTDTEKFSKQKYHEIVNHCAPLKFNQCIMMVQVIQASRKSAHELKNLEGEDIFLSRPGDDVCNQKLLHIVSIFDKRDWLIK